jgi:putative phosphonate catabolism associated alcohol dehydrogenase
MQVQYLAGVPDDKGQRMWLGGALRPSQPHPRSVQQGDSMARAQVFSGPGHSLRLEEFEPRPPRGREVLVRVRCCTLCGSDLHTWSGRRATPTPTILGHEILGEVAGLGPEAPKVDLAGQPLRVGDRITWTIAASCGTCFYCDHELPQKCEHLFKYGHEAIVPDHPLSGGLAEVCLLAPGTGIVCLPDELPDLTACPANCATATVVAALRQVGGVRDRVVLIQGAGMLGLTACARARAEGALKVLCTDLDVSRARRALAFGADVAVAAKGGELESAVREATGGRGVDVALELSGAPAALEAGLPLLRLGGRYGLVGSVFPTPPVTLVPETVVRRHLTLHGVHNYLPADLMAAVGFLAGRHRHHPFAELVEETFSLAEATRAFDRAAGAIRVAVVP